MTVIKVDPVALRLAASELDAVAARLQAAVTATALPVRPLPPGTDEVSLLTDRFFATAADTFGPAAAQGISELHRAAEELRKQAADYLATDDDTAGGLPGLAGI